MPIPNATWSGEASTATASGDSENSSGVVVGVDVDDLRGRLVVRPLPNPPLVEPGGLGQLGGRRGPAEFGERDVQAEPVAEVDHARR